MEDEDRRPDRTSVGWCGRGRVQNTFAGYASGQNRQHPFSFSTPHAGQGRAGEESWGEEGRRGRGKGRTANASDGLDDGVVESGALSHHPTEELTVPFSLWPSAIGRPPCGHSSDQARGVGRDTRLTSRPSMCSDASGSVGHSRYDRKVKGEIYVSDVRDR